MKENFESSKKNKKGIEESLGDYQSAVDHLVVSGEMAEIRDRKEILRQSIRDMENRPEVTGYFSKKSELLVAKEEVQHLKPLIEEAIKNAGSPVSKEKLDIAIARLRENEESFETLTKEIASMTENDVHVKATLLDIDNIENEIKSLDEKAEEVARLYESNEEKSSPRDTTSGLN